MRQSLLIIVVHLLFQKSFTKENPGQNPDYLENDDAVQGVIFYNKSNFKLHNIIIYITFDFFRAKNL